MTSIVLDETGKRYNLKTQPFIGDLRRLKEEFGIGYGTCVEHVAKLKLDGSNYLELLDTDGFPDAFLGWIWMLRLRTGERDVTAADMRMIELDSWHFEPDPSDAAESDTGDQPGGDDEVPTSAPTGGSRGDDAGEPVADLAATDPAAAEPTAASTTTSSKPSSTGSSSSATGGRGSRRPRSGA